MSALTIKRTCANKVITRVLALDEQPFTAVLLPDADDCIVSNNRSLAELLAQNPGAYVVHNQHPTAQDSVQNLSVDDQQVVIEVRQETRGVLGLQARFIHNSDDIIELVYPENT